MVLASNSESLGNTPEEEATASWELCALAKGSRVVVAMDVDLTL